MAENIDFSPLQQALEQFTRSTEQSVATQMGYYRDSDGILKKLQKTEKSRLELEDKLNKELIATYGQRKVVSDKQKELYKQQLANLGYIVDSTGKIAKAVGSVDLSRAQQRQIARLEEADKKQKALIEAQVNFTRNLTAGAADIGKSLGGFAAELASGNTSFTALNPIIDAVANTMSSLASAIPLLGGVISGTVKAAAEGAKLILMLAEKNLKTFQDLSSVGATVVDGMTGMTRQVLQSGMTMEGFVKTVKSNAETLSRYGGTVGIGAERFTKAVGMLTIDGGPLSQAGMELRKLGLTADDIGERAAAYLEQEMLLGRGRSMTSDQLAKGTVAYTKELTALQKITGMQRADIEKERTKLLNKSRVAATIADMEARGAKGGAKAALNLLTTVPEDLKAGVEEMLAGFIGPEAGKLIATFGAGIVDLIEPFKTAVTDQEGIAAFDNFNKGMKSIATDSKETFRGVSMISDAFVSYATINKLATSELGSFKDALVKTNTEAKNQDALTKSTIQAQINMENLSRTMMLLANTVMPSVTAATASFTSAMVQAMNTIVPMLNSSSMPSAPPSAGSKIVSTLKGSAIGAGVGAIGGGILGSIAGPAGTVAGAKLGAVVGTGVGGWLGGKFGGGTSSASSTSPANLDDIFIFTGNSGSRANFERLDPKIKSAVINAATEYNQATGRKIQINSAARDPADQLRLYQETINAGRRGFGPNNMPVAEPGSSPHEKGLAVDIQNYNDPAAVSAFNRQGLFQKVPNDPVHFQMKYGGIASGPQTGFPVMLHGPKEAVVPLATDSILEKLAQTPASNLSNNSLSSSIDESRILMMLSDKFDQMIDKLSAGVNIQDQILKYSRT